MPSYWRKMQEQIWFLLDEDEHVLASVRALTWLEAWRKFKTLPVSHVKGAAKIREEAYGYRRRSD